MAEEKGALQRSIQAHIMEEIEERRSLSDEELWELIDKEILGSGDKGFVPLKEKLELRTRLFDSFRRLGILQELVDDRQVTEIMVNGREKIFIERGGKVALWDRCFDSEEQLEDMIQQIVSRVDRMVNVSSPIVDARLEDGSRVHVVLPPIALDGPAVTIRKFPEPITLEKLIRYQSLTEEAAEFLKVLVASGYNIFISGGTNSGKSTFLNALSAFIPKEERVITIEDSAELQIQQMPNLVRLEARNANGEGEGAVTIRDLIKAALRMNPDRIVVGEVRGGEAFDLLTAFNTGQSRRVLKIVEIVGMDQGEIRLNPLFTFLEDGAEGEGRTGADERPAVEPAKRAEGWQETEKRQGTDRPLETEGRQRADRPLEAEGQQGTDRMQEAGKLRRMGTVQRKTGAGEGGGEDQKEGKRGKRRFQKRQEKVEGRLVAVGQLTRKEKLWAAGYGL